MVGVAPVARAAIRSWYRRTPSSVSKLTSAGASWRIAGGSAALWQPLHQSRTNGSPKLA
jgi:hypothetical protein